METNAPATVVSEACSGVVPGSNMLMELGAALKDKTRAWIPGTTSFREALSSCAGHSALPLCICRVMSEDEVCSTVRVCAKFQLKIAVCGGGHTVHCSGNGTAVMIDLRSLNRVSVRESTNTVTADGGATVKDLARASERAGLILPLGTCGSVGLGSILQGGVGHLTRWKGRSVDNVVGLRIVLPDGSVRSCSPTQERDLFWACKGAAPNFGVVTAITMSAFRDTSKWFCAHLTAPNSPVQALNVYAEESAKLPITSSVSLFINTDAVFLFPHTLH
jgi:FAD/FMN-containing dehydrogenase